jgi:hypothetical protein
VQFATPAGAQDQIDTCDATILYLINILFVFDSYNGVCELDIGDISIKSADDSERSLTAIRCICISITVRVGVRIGVRISGGIRV